MFHSFFPLKRASALFLGLGLLLTMACNNNNNDNTPQPQTITQIVQGNANFSVLLAAIQRAGGAENIAGLLNGSGNFTVFAPDNDAFAASGINTNTLNSLTPQQVANILKYHVIASARVSAAQVTTGQVATALTGSEIFLTKETNGGVTINGAVEFTRARVKQADVAASNGVIHVVDRVIMPRTIEALVIALSDQTTGAQFTLLRAAIVRAGLLGALDAAGPFTVFAPTDAAFQNTQFNTVTAINNADATVLSNILRYHIINNARVYASQVQNNANVTMFNGGTLQTLVSAGAVSLNDSGSTTNANVVIANVVSSNGVVHVIDKVLLP